MRCGRRCEAADTLCGCLPLQHVLVPSCSAVFELRVLAFVCGRFWPVDFESLSCAAVAARQLGSCMAAHLPRLSSVILLFFCMGGRSDICGS